MIVPVCQWTDIEIKHWDKISQYAHNGPWNEQNLALLNSFVKLNYYIWYKCMAKHIKEFDYFSNDLVRDLAYHILYDMTFAY